MSQFLAAYHDRVEANDGATLTVWPQPSPIDAEAFARSLINTTQGLRDGQIVASAADWADNPGQLAWADLTESAPLGASTLTWLA